MNTGTSFSGKVEHPTVSFVAVSHRTSWFWATTISYMVVGTIPMTLAIAALTRLLQAVLS